MKEKTKLILAALAVAAGLCLLGTVLLAGERLPGGINGLLSGCGGALIGVGGSALIIPLAIKAMSPEERREMERNETDERSISIREKAAQSSWYWSLYLLWIPFVVALVQNSVLWIVLTAGAIVLHCTFYLVNIGRWAKKM